MSAANSEARSCNGKVIWLKRMVGSGIASRSTNNTNFSRPSMALPSSVQMRPAISTTKEVRCTKRSAPSTPSNNSKSPSATSQIPDHVGMMGVLRLSLIHI